LNLHAERNEVIKSKLCFFLSKLFQDELSRPSI
jgi:hypothetical protein